MTPFWFFVLALVVIGVALIVYSKVKPASKVAADVNKVEAAVSKGAAAVEADVKKVI